MAQTPREPGRMLPALAGRGWDLYLLLVVALTPFVAPIGGTPAAWPDLVNGVALLVFAAGVAARRTAFELPLLPAVLVAAAGSVLAVSNAASLALSAVALAQDAYLYAWLVLAVALLRGRGEALFVRMAWGVVAAGVGLGCLVEAARSGGGLLSLHGHRCSATFGNANMCAAYLLVGVFVWLGLAGRVRRSWVAAALALIALALLTTKSNGPLFALAAGLGVWAAVRAYERGVSVRRLAGVAALGVAALLLAVWAVGVEGAGAGWFQALGEDTMFARMEHSGETRGRIWQRLEHTLSHDPLGIGPGNSSQQQVDIGERERKGSMQAKEAHSDYVGYAVERGPLGLAGLLAALVALATRVARGRRWLDARVGARQGGDLCASFSGALAALVVQSSVIEQLHFRHLWLFIALLWAMTGPAALTDEAPHRTGPAATRRGPGHAPEAGAALEGHPA